MSVYKRFTVKKNGRLGLLPGASKAICKDGRRTITFRNGNKDSESNNFPYKRLLVVNAGDIIANLEQDIALAREESGSLESRLESLQAEKYAVTSEYEQLGKELFEKGKEINKMKSEKTELQGQLNDVQAAGDTDFGPLEAELAELKVACDEVSLQWQDMSREHEEMHEEVTATQVSGERSDVCHDADCSGEGCWYMNL
jgi:chromosome segregation ATPase